MHTLFPTMWIEKVQYSRVVQTHRTRKFSVCRVVVHLSRVVQAHQTSSNLHEPLQRCRERTFSIYIIAGETRCAWCLSPSSGWFKHIEPHRIYSNHNITEIARCGEVFHMSSGWFNRTKTFLSTSLKGKQGVQGAYAQGWSHEPPRTIA